MGIRAARARGRGHRPTGSSEAPSLLTGNRVTCSVPFSAGFPPKKRPGIHNPGCSALRPGGPLRSRPEQNAARNAAGHGSRSQRPLGDLQPHVTPRPALEERGAALNSGAGGAGKGTWPRFLFSPTAHGHGQGAPRRRQRLFCSAAEHVEDEPLAQELEPAPTAWSQHSRGDPGGLIWVNHG